MERGRRTRFLRLMAAAALYLWAFAACRGAEESKRVVYLALENGVSPQTAAEIFAQKEDPVGCCFWGEEEEWTVSCQSTGRTARAARVYLGGNAELLGVWELAWQDGCLIDEQTAEHLFGTVQCGAQELSWEDRSWPVLGTVPALRPTVVMMAREEDRMTRCVLALPAENGKALGEQFLMRFGLRGKVLDFFPLWALARNLLLLAPMVFLLSLYQNLGANRARPQDASEALCHCEPARFPARQLHKIFRSPDWIRRCEKGLILGLILLLLWKGTVIPPDLIPSRWSDFSFWGGWWEAWKENLRGILFTSLGGRQLQILLNMVKSVIGSILSAFLARPHV